MYRPVPGLQQQAHMQRSSSSRPLPQPPAAAAADLTASVLPYISPRAPKLHSRRMQGSPMDGLWGAASAALLRLELAAAAAVDRHARYGPLVASCLAGVAAGMGIDAFTLLQYVLPGYFQDLLLAAFGAWDTTLWAVALTAAALPVTAWAGWLGTPAARWEPLLPFVADAACGMFVGETRSVQLLNPKAGGYWNPSFSWWQPTADVMAKFRGQMPAPGDVFLYPVSEGAYVPTRVAAIGEKYVELDANYGVTGAGLQLEVTLVALQKQ
ncbi:hypothetical protein OEZ85_001941 [Tetradesmus obliquus]|uniref:Uncharacterized protein n=1 Tax=Tetradesmus obliquus TaxID=3088 RepID=A0ABY8U1K2_TETOB|nr:hypothetical protein OEZ85_001941 [Tetradesmus obliquus]